MSKQTPENKSTDKPHVITVVGPTASGKSDLAVCIAKKFNGEVISVDSRQVYRGLDIGSGKITKEEMCGVPHHLLDVANPKRTFTAAQFVKKAERAIADILKRGKVPILAGGTGFYLSALLGEVSLPQVAPNKKLRATLEKLSTEELNERLSTLDPDRAEAVDPRNRPRLVRAIEIAESLGKVPKIQTRSPYHVLKIGIKTDVSLLSEKIHTRLLSRLDEGMLEEAQRLHAGGVSFKRMEALGLEYRYMARYLQGLISKEEMITELETKIRQYAKRQRTWLRREKDLHWVEAKDIKKVEGLVSEFLNK